MYKKFSGNGKMIRPMDGEDSFMQMETFMKGSGKKIKLTEKVFTLTPMEPNMMEIGKKINNMDMELKHGQMAQSMMDST